MIGGMSPPRPLPATKPRGVRHRTRRAPVVVRADPDQAGAAGAAVKDVNAGAGINIMGMAAADSLRVVTKVVPRPRSPDLQAYLMRMVPNLRRTRLQGLSRVLSLPRCRIQSPGKSLSSARISPSMNRRPLTNAWIRRLPRFSGKASQRPFQNRITVRTTTATATGKEGVCRRVFA